MKYKLTIEIEEYQLKKLLSGEYKGIGLGCLRGGIVAIDEPELSPDDYCGRSVYVDGKPALCQYSKPCPIHSIPMEVLANKLIADFIQAFAKEKGEV